MKIPAAQPDPIVQWRNPRSEHRPVLQEPACEILMGAKEAPWILSVAEQETRQS